MNRKSKMLVLAGLLIMAGGIQAWAKDKPRIKSLRRKAKAAYRGGFFDVAADYYGQFLRQANNGELLMEAGIGLTKSRFAQFKFDEADKGLESFPARYAKLRARNPKLPEKLPRESMLLISYWRGRVLLVKDEPTKALEALTPVLQSKDNNLRIGARRYLGRSYLALEQWDKAEAEFRWLEQKGGSQEDVQAGRLGSLEVLMRQEKWQELEAEYAKWKKKAKGAWLAKLTMFRVLILLERGQVKEALAGYNENVEPKKGTFKDQANYLIVRTLAQRLGEVRKFDQARTFYQRIMPSLPFDAQRQEMLLSMAETAVAAADYHGAIDVSAEIPRWYKLAEDDLSVFLKLYSRAHLAPRALYRRGQIRRLRGNLAQAVQDFQNVRRHKQADPLTRFEATVQLAEYQRRKLKKPDPALDLYTQAAKLPVSKNLQAYARLMRGDIFNQARKYFDAAQEYKAVAEQFPLTDYAGLARYKEAHAYFQAGQFNYASACLAKFLGDFPGHKLRPGALFYKGVSHRLASQWDNALKTMRQFVKEYPTHRHAPRGLLQASEAAIAADLDPDALSLLDQIIEDYPNARETSLALYRRIYVYLQYQYDEVEAFADSETFLKKYAKNYPELAADILLWLGDYHAGNRNYRAAEEYFLKVFVGHPKLAVAATALYEAAKSAYYRKEYNSALDHLKLLEDNYPTCGDRIKAQAYYLQGDIYSLRGNYKKAESLFLKSTELVEGRNLYYAALGRIGDMKFSRAGKAEYEKERDQLYQQALKYYGEITDKKRDDLAFMQKTRFRRGLVYEHLKDFRAAKTEYIAILSAYNLSRIQQQHWDWFYFVRASLRLAKLYEKEQQYARAIAVYEKIAQSNTSFAKEARELAKELQDRFLPAPKK